MLQKTRAIVLHTIKYGESSLVVQTYTERWGRVSFLLKGVRKSGKSGKASLFQPLFILDLEVYFKDGREMQWIKEATLSGPGSSFSGDVVKSTQAIFISELLSRTLTEEEENPVLFGFLYHSIAVLSNPEFRSSSFHLLFMFKLMKYLGHFPQNNFSAENCFFDLSTGSFTSLASGEDLSARTRMGAAWHRSFQTEYATADQVFSNHRLRNEFLDSLIDFYRLHYSHFGQLKSLEVLRSVFDDL